METFKSNKNSFKTPTNYFQELEDSILAEGKSFEQGKGFVVPNDYFNQLEQKIVSKSISSNRSNVRLLWTSISSVAACLAVGVTLFYFNSSDSKMDSLSNLVKGQSNEVDENVEDAVYKSLYKSYFVDEEPKKSSNEITLDDLDDFYSDQQLSSSY